MKTNNQQGRTFVIIIGIYLVIKTVLNMIIGGGLDIGGLLWNLILFAAMFTGLQYVNFGVAAVLAVVAVSHLPANISNFGSNWIYLIEGIIDIACAALLCFEFNIKDHFTNKWSEILTLFKQ